MKNLTGLNYVLFFILSISCQNVNPELTFSGIGFLTEHYLESIKAKENFTPEINSNYQTKKNKHIDNKLTRNNKYLIVIVITLLLAIVICFGLIKRNMTRIKKILIEKENITSDYEKKREQLKTLLLQRFEISKKLAIMSSVTDDKEHRALKKINEIMYGKSTVNFNWDEFYLLFNELYDDLSIKLPQIYPQLSSDEIHLCCLIQAEFETGELSFILNLAPITIRMRKTAIRKKVGIKDGSDLRLLFNRLIKNRVQ